MFVEPLGGWANMNETAKLSASDGAATGQLIKAIAWLDAGEINRARNNLNDFRYHALAILDITEGNPTGNVDPCYLVALDVVEGVLATLPVPVLSEQALLASGFVDLMVDAGLDNHDFGPLEPIVRNAGGVAMDWDGRARSMDSSGDIIAAGDARLIEQVRAQLER